MEIINQNITEIKIDTLIKQENIRMLPSISHGIEIDDLIATPPGYLLRFGVTMIAFVLALLLIFAAVIKYPETILAPAYITNTIPPIELFSKEAGKITWINKKAGLVKKGEVILKLENTTDETELQIVEDHLKIVENALLKENVWPASISDTLYHLGTLQSDYSLLKEKIKNLHNVLEQTSVPSQIESIRQEIDKIKLHNQSLLSEQKIFAKELELKAKDHERQKGLRNAGVISPLDLEKNESEYLQYQRSYEQIKANQVQNLIRLTALQTEITKQRESRTETLQSLRQELRNLTARLRQDISTLNDRYQIICPEAGSIYIHDEIQPGSQLKGLQSIGFVTSEATSSNNYKLHISLPSLKSGKVIKGNKVIFTPDAYPAKEYGRIISTLDSINQYPRFTEDKKSYYLSQASLSDSLITEYKKQIAYTPLMPGTAIVYTDSRSLLFRIFETFYHLIKKQEL